MCQKASDFWSNFAAKEFYELKSWLTLYNHLISANSLGNLLGNCIDLPNSHFQVKVCI